MTIIDVREPVEYKSGHYDGAINIPLSEITSSKQLENIPKDEKIIVYCRSGSRSTMAQNFLKQQGYTAVINGINQQSINQFLD